MSAYHIESPENPFSNRPAVVQSLELSPRRPEEPWGHGWWRGMAQDKQQEAILPEQRHLTQLLENHRCSTPRKTTWKFVSKEQGFYKQCISQHLKKGMEFLWLLYFSKTKMLTFAALASLPCLVSCYPLAPDRPQSPANPEHSFTSIHSQDVCV